MVRKSGLCFFVWETPQRNIDRYNMDNILHISGSEEFKNNMMKSLKFFRIDVFICI